MITKLFDLVREFYRNILLAREAAGLGRRGNVEEVRAFLQQATKWAKKANKKQTAGWQGINKPVT
jgi:hypothetical protein